MCQSGKRIFLNLNSTKQEWKCLIQLVQGGKHPAPQETQGHYQAYDIQKQYINYGKTTEDFKKHVDEMRNKYFNDYR